MVVHSPTTITADSPSGRGRTSWPSLHPRWRVDSLVWVLCMEPQLHWAYECNGHATSKRHLLMADLPTSSSYIFFFFLAPVLQFFLSLERGDIYILDMSLLPILTYLQYFGQLNLCMNLHPLRYEESLKTSGRHSNPWV